MGLGQLPTADGEQNILVPYSKSGMVGLARLTYSLKTRCERHVIPMEKGEEGQGVLALRHGLGLKV